MIFSAVDAEVARGTQWSGGARSAQSVRLIKKSAAR